MEYTHEQAVADGVNVDYDVYRIRTADHRGRARTVEAGVFVDQSATGRPRKMRWEKLDEDLTYDGQAARPRRGRRGPDPHRRPDLPGQAVHRDLPRPHRGAQDADLRQGRHATPRTSSQIVREEFGKGNDFCQKITYKTTGQKPEDLLSDVPQLATTRASRSRST